MKSFESERRKSKLSPNEFIAVQQPIDRKTGKVNELFVKAFGKKKLPKKNNK